MGPSIRSSRSKFLPSPVITQPQKPIGEPKGAFHSSELTGQTILVAMIISPVLKLSSEISHILHSMHRGVGFSAKTLGKNLLHYQTDWSARPVLKNGKRPKFHRYGLLCSICVFQSRICPLEYNLRSGSIFVSL